MTLDLISVPPPLLVAHARTALKIALHQMGMQSGDKILVPDFICGVVLHPILQTGLIPIYYPVAPDLAPDWQALESIASNSNCQALIMVHYFGQPQNVEQFQTLCLRHNLLLIEDNAHGYGGFLAGRLLGSFGDIGISSPRKILGTPSGGILHGASASSSEFVQNMRPFPAYRPVSVFKTVLHSMPRIRRFIKGWVDRNKNWNNPRLFQEPEQPDHGIDCFSLQRITSADWQAVATRRRENWVAWEYFALNKVLLPVFLGVHPESCPWAMPAYAGDQLERNSWLAWGARNGVSLFPWPSLPEDVILFDGAALARWKTLVCFPLGSTPNELGL